MIKKKISKILAPFYGSKNSIRDLETAISLARNCGATLAGMYSIHDPTTFRIKDVGSVEKFLEEVKTVSSQKGIVFYEKTMKGGIV